MYVRVCDKETKRQIERKKVSKPDLFQNMSQLHLVSLLLGPSFPVLLVGKPITTQATSIEITPARATTTEETQELNAKRNLSLSTLSNREEFF